MTKRMLVRKMSRLAGLALALTAGLACAGCGLPFEAATPAGFVELEDQDERGYEWRATSADGLVLAVRAKDHEPKGELTFWAKVVENHMRQSGGYALLSKSNVKTTQGVEGTMLRFGHDQGATPHLYWVTVLVTESHIYLLEAGGTKELVEGKAKDIEAWVMAFRAD
ncbi:MAG: serine/threonine protein kinase [Polyangiaceae bacterium]|nr:serine/threonine protein kinase [Polyangiaceae bacterium]